jgi:hypothetical protein
VAEWLDPFQDWLQDVGAWTKRQRRTPAPKSPLVHRFELSPPVLCWYRETGRTQQERRAFASLLLTLDGCPVQGRFLPSIPGGRSLGFEGEGIRFGVIYQLVPAAQCVRIITLTLLA